MGAALAMVDVEAAVGSRLRDTGLGFECRDLRSDSPDVDWPASLADASAAVVGSDVRDAARLLARIGRVNRDLPVMVLRTAEHREQLVQQLRFVPGVGRHVRICKPEELDKLVEELAAATRRRQSLQALNQGLKAAQRPAPAMSTAAYLDPVLEFAPVGVAVLDPEARIRELNRAAEGLFGWTRGAARQRALAERFQPDDRERLAAMVARCQAGQATVGPEAFELRHPLRNAVAHVQVSVGRIGERTSVHGCAVYIDDVSDLIHSQQALEQARDRLEQKIAERTRALSQVKSHLESRGEELERSNRALTEAKAELEALSIRDPLTGLYNRRYLDTRLREECQRLGRYQSAMALLMIDVDHFKAYNDGLGHVEGDRCLSKVASVIGNSCRRSGEFAVRYGGEEFTVVLPGATADAALQFAEAVRAQIAALEIPHPSGKVVTVSVGVGCASGLQALVNPVLLTSRADTALYQSKRDGRNRVSVQLD